MELCSAASSGSQLVIVLSKATVLKATVQMCFQRRERSLAIFQLADLFDSSSVVVGGTRAGRDAMSFTRPVLHDECQIIYEDDTRSGQVLDEMHKVCVVE